MNLVNTITMSLDDYERMQAQIREQNELISQYDDALTDREEGKEVFVMTEDRNGRYWIGSVDRTVRILNPSDYTKEMKKTLEKLDAENKRLNDEIRALKKRSLLKRIFH